MVWYSSSPSFIHDEEGFGLEPQELSMLCERSMEMGSQKTDFLWEVNKAAGNRVSKWSRVARMFPNFLEGFRTFPTFSRISRSFQEGFKNKYAECLKIECSRIHFQKQFLFWKILECSRIFWNTIKFYPVVVGIHSTTQKGV